jgi:hypothetical protein
MAESTAPTAEMMVKTKNPAATAAHTLPACELYLHSCCQTAAAASTNAISIKAEIKVTIALLPVLIYLTRSSRKYDIIPQFNSC